MKRYRALITREEHCEFEFEEADMEDGDTPEEAALELMRMDFAGTDPFIEDLEEVEITEL